MKRKRNNMAEFERWVKESREAWRRGEAVILLPFGEWLRLTAHEPTIIQPADPLVGPPKRKTR